MSFATLLLVDSVLLGAVAASFLMRHWKNRIALAAHGIAVQVVPALIAGAIQALGVIPGLGGNDPLVRLLVPLLGLPFNVGGYSVRTIFEALATERSMTAMDSLHIYVPLLVVHIAMLAGLMIWRYGKVKTVRDPLLIGISVFIVLNSFLNITWPWWGS